MKSFALLLAAFALVATACSSNATVLATVDGTDITDDDIALLRTSYQGDAITFNDQFRTDLSNLIIQEAVRSKLRSELNVVISEAEIDERLANLSEAEAGAIEDFRTRSAVGDVGNPDMDTGYERAFATSFLIRESAVEALAAREIEQIYTDAPSAVTQVCVRHVLVATEPEIEEVLDRLESGEDFSAVADEVSLDTASPGGVLPCPAFAASFVDPFAAAAMTAPIGELTGPVQSDFGFHAMIVDDRTTPTFDEVADDIEGTVFPPAVDGLWSAWLAAALEGVVVELDPRVGTWSEDAFAIVPPQE
ncbi:MAG: hypothetical protein HKN07_02135 [Acidimicrobiia bacterium]|nr:hypothetical protein [Acidimicrobiia bacterium]